mgnify:CR=1 FL=1
MLRKFLSNFRFGMKLVQKVSLILIVNKQLATWLLFIKFLVNKSNIGDLIIIIIIIIIINCLTPVMYACLSVSHTDDVVMPFG